MRINNGDSCAYDAFNQELIVGDEVLVIVNQSSSINILYKAEVLGWSNKKIKLEIKESAINSDNQDIYPDAWWRKVGNISFYNPDKIYKIKQRE